MEELALPGPFAIWPHVVLMEWAIQKYSKGRYQHKLLTGYASWNSFAFTASIYQTSQRNLQRRIQEDGRILFKHDNGNDQRMKFCAVDPKLCLMVEMALALDQEKNP